MSTEEKQVQVDITNLNDQLVRLQKEVVVLKEALNKRESYIHHLEKQVNTHTPNEAAGTDQRPSNESLIAQHIAEMRELRKQLEQSIKNNDALRAQLEYRLSQVEKEAEQMRDPHLRITLIRENDNLRTQLTEKQELIKKQKTTVDQLLKEKGRLVFSSYFR